MLNNGNTCSVEFLTSLPLDQNIESDEKEVLVLLCDVSEFDDKNRLRINVKTYCIDLDIGMEIPISYIKQIFDNNKPVFDVFVPKDKKSYVVEKQKDYSYDLVF